jgi:hypothetical protein
MINKIIYEIRRMQDFLIKTNTKSKIANAISKKLKKNDNNELNLNPKSDEEDVEAKDRYEVTS